MPRVTDNATLGPLDRQKLREEAVRWDREAGDKERTASHAPSNLETRLLGMEARVLRSCAQRLKDLADGRPVRRG